jgi:aspartate racemase
MKTIGLIGGMSWESTAVYYRLINTMVRERLGGLHSAEILLRSVDFDRIAALQRTGDWTTAGTILADIASTLVQAGADNVLICTNTMHLVAPIVADRPGMRLIHVIDETAAAIRAAGCQRPLLLATAYTMEHGFYAARMAANGLDILTPNAPDRAETHRIIYDELCQGIIRPDSHAAATAIIARGRAAGADCVILGCTEICLLLDPDQLGCPGFDSTAIHARAAVDDALGTSIAAAA